MPVSYCSEKSTKICWPDKSNIACQFDRSSASLPIFRLNGLDPPGKELADLIAHRLADAGFAVDGPGDREGWAWECYTKDDQLEIITIVGFVDDMELDPPRQWLITNYCELGFLRRLFGGKLLEEKRCRFLRRFCEAMHQFITCDDRFSGVVWYNKETFDRPGDQPGATP